MTSDDMEQPIIDALDAYFSKAFGIANSDGGLVMCKSLQDNREILMAAMRVPAGHDEISRRFIDGQGELLDRIIGEFGIE